MFCLKQPKDSTISYYNLNRGSVTDTEMEEMLGREWEWEWQLSSNSSVYGPWSKKENKLGMKETKDENFPIKLGFLFDNYERVKRCEIFK